MSSSFNPIFEGVLQNCTTLRMFSFTHNFFSRASIICDFWIHHISNKQAKLEGSIHFISKVTAFFWKVPTMIFVNPGWCPWKSVKTEKDTSLSENNPLYKIWTGSVCFTLPIDLYHITFLFFPIVLFFF